MKVIGLAGRPGSGKSAAARALACRPGVEWIDLDPVAWETYAAGTETYDRLIDRFGSGILASDGAIDRGRLAARVFGDQEALRDLERIVHPAVSRRLGEILHRLRVAGVRLALVEGALLASSAHVDLSMYDAVVWLEADAGVRARRLRNDGRQEHAERGDRIRPNASAIVVDANGSVDDVAAKLLEVARSLGVQAV